jgi:hypothetical protein
MPIEMLLIAVDHRRACLTLQLVSGFDVNQPRKRRNHSIPAIIYSSAGFYPNSSAEDF